MVKALELAAALEGDAVSPIDLKAAAELRRLHASNEALIDALEHVEIECSALYHSTNDTHKLSEPCPVVARINAAIKQAEEQK